MYQKENEYLEYLFKKYRLNSKDYIWDNYN